MPAASLRKALRPVAPSGQPRYPATGKVATWLPTWVVTLPQTWQVAWQPGIIADGTLSVTHLAEPIPQFDRIKVCLPSTAQPWSSSHQALFWEMICPDNAAVDTWERQSPDGSVDDADFFQCRFLFV